MKSKLFRSFSNIDEAFKKDINVLWEIPAKERELLIPIIRRFMFAETNREVDSLREEATSSIDFDKSKLLIAIKMLRFLQQLWNPVIDQPSDVVQDIRDLGLLPSDGADIAEAFLIRFFEVVKQDSDERMKRSFASSCLPNYLSVDAVVDLRAVFRNPFGFGENEQIALYKPECIGFVPVAVIEIERDEDEPKKFRFQIEKSALKRFIDNLNATLNEIEVAEKQQ